ncbi:uncharacterized protein LOC135387458 [Ornithodoros turicata]|uniref:uncharacterized protein LOC135387458 n=1 Tax=Ornithodoros turicata TaxID=34597 RepID=UPI003138DCB6
MLKLLLNHWQDSHHKARVQSEDPLLCTDLAKTRPNEEFSVSRVNPVFVDSSAEASPNFRLKRSEVPNSEVAASPSPQVQESSDQQAVPVETPKEDTPSSDDAMNLTSLDSSTEPKSIIEDQASDSGRESGSSPSGTTPVEGGTTKRPLVELKQWERDVCSPSLLTQEKISLIEKVIAQRFSKQLPESSFLHPRKEEKVEQETTKGQITEKPDETKGELPETTAGKLVETKEKLEETKEKLEEPKEKPSEKASAGDLNTATGGTSRIPPIDGQCSDSNVVSEAEANQEHTEVIAETMSPPVLRRDESSGSETVSKTTGSEAQALDRTTSEDSGITRGDQVHSDDALSDTAPKVTSTRSDSSDHSADSKAKKRSALHVKAARSHRHHRSGNKLRCSFCMRDAKRNHVKKSKHRSIAVPEIVSSSGSLTDLAFEHPWLSDGCMGCRSSVSCMERDYPYEEFCNAVHRHSQGHMPMFNYDSCCSSVHGHGNCWPEPPRSRFSWTGGEDSTPCTCRRSQPHYSSKRKVKFAQRTPSQRTEQEEEKTDERTTDHEDSAKESDKPPSDVKIDANNVKANDHVLMEGGMLDGGVVPWHEWQLYMRQKDLQSKRKRALCMGVIALSIVVFVGVSVSLALAFLRRKF